MINEWKDFLLANGAELDDTGLVASFGSLKRELSMALTGNVFADLSHIAVITAHGKDAETFLQGQFSNDIREVSTSHSQLSSYCSPKGRMLANFRLFKRDDSYYFSMPGTIRETFLKRLRMFVMMSDVTLEDVSENFVHIGVAGPEAIGELTEILGEIPHSVDDVVTRGQCSIIRVPGIQPRFEIYGPLEEMQKHWEALNVRFAPVGRPAWGLLSVMAGVPAIYPETSDAFVPQMANMQVINGVSFKKGCYPGQEVVARMQYLGKLKRRMYLVRIPADPPQPGSDLFTKSDPDQSAGKIVEAYPHPDGGSVGLAVIQIASAEEHPLHLDSSTGPKLELLELPYAVPESAKAG